jgi:hypothetical protein
MRFENPAIAIRVFEIMQGAEEIATRGRRRICKLLWRLGVNQGSMETPVVTARMPPAGRAE